jgi:FkbM family methyltransferase
MNFFYFLHRLFTIHGFEKFLLSFYLKYLKLLSIKNKIFFYISIRTSFSAQYQDRYVVKLFNFKPGFYVDIGAFDGISNNNTLLLDKFYNWKGICIEPNPISYKKLLRYRKKSINYNIAISNYKKKLQKFSNLDQLSRLSKKGNVLVKNFSLKNILKKKKIDFLKIDVEGHELNVIRSIDFRKTTIKSILIERPTRKINSILKKNNFFLNKIFLFDYLYLNERFFDLNKIQFIDLPKRTI